MNILLMVGNHPRHTYIAEQVQATDCLARVIIEDRGEQVPETPEHLNANLRDLYTHHFQKRAEAESDFFGDCSMSTNCPKMDIDRTELNSNKVQEIIENVQPDLTLTYGVHKLTDETLACIPGEKWNIHGGLSPQYRGVITHFWPSYMLEPQMTGMTLHELTSELDAGPIVHQTSAPLVQGDGLHELACRTVKKFGSELKKVIRILKAGELSEPHKQESKGKLWVSNDWRPDHLKVIYEKFDNEIVDLYLDGQLSQNAPKLIRQFELDD